MTGDEIAAARRKADRDVRRLLIGARVVTFMAAAAFGGMIGTAIAAVFH